MFVFPDLPLEISVIINEFVRGQEHRDKINQIFAFIKKPVYKKQTILRRMLFHDSGLYYESFFYLRKTNRFTVKKVDKKPILAYSSSNAIEIPHTCPVPYIGEFELARHFRGTYKAYLAPVRHF